MDIRGSVLLEVGMDSRGTAGGPGPVVPGPVAPSRAVPRRHSGRDQALARLDRWKRGIAVATVVGFGGLIGLVGAIGARGATSPTTPSLRGPSDDGTRHATANQSSDDGFFGNGSGGEDGGGGFGFGSGGSQGAPLGRSGAS